MRIPTLKVNRWSSVPERWPQESKQWYTFLTIIEIHVYGKFLNDHVNIGTAVSEVSFRVDGL